MFLEALAAAGRRREEVSVLISTEVDEPDLLSDLGGVAARWHERGADELVVHWVKPDHLDAVIAAGERAGLGG